MSTALQRRFDDIIWVHVLWFGALHFLAIPLSAWYATSGATLNLGPFTSTFSWYSVIVAFVLYLYVHFSITCGVHRLLTHRAYQTSGRIQWVFLVGFSAAFQSVARWWIGKHARHHAEVDTDGDPHNIKKGGWWAHTGWVLSKEAFKPEARKYTKHLREDPELWRRIKLQAKWYYPFAILVGLVLPMAVCSLWGDPVGGLFIGGFSRLVWQYHTTWAANSLAHMYGERKYGSSTGTGNKILGLLLNVGEGCQHDYHHAVPYDWRLEPKISWFNPGTWVLWTLREFGLAWDFKEGSPRAIQKALEDAKAQHG